MFGVACLGLLLSLCWASVGGAKDARQVAWVAALVVWVLAEFLHAAWRLALPSVLLVLTQVEFVEPSSNGQSEGIELAGWECCDEELPAN